MAMMGSMAEMMITTMMNVGEGMKVETPQRKRYHSGIRPVASVVAVLVAEAVEMTPARTTRPAKVIGTGDSNRRDGDERGKRTIRL